MKNLIVGIVLVAAAVPAEAGDLVSMRFNCPSASAPGQPPELAGTWDLVMDVGGIPSFGVVSVGRFGDNLTGSITLNAGVAVVRSLKLEGRAVAMVVVTGEGEVRFDGSLSADGRRMCGEVTYHEGQKYQMVAQKKPDRTNRAAPAAADRPPTAR